MFDEEARVDRDTGGGNVIILQLDLQWMMMIVDATGPTIRYCAICAPASEESHLTNVLNFSKGTVSLRNWYTHY